MTAWRIELSVYKTSLMSLSTLEYPELMLDYLSMVYVVDY